MDKKSKQVRPELDSDGGFNPERPEPPATLTVGPLPTGDPDGKADASLKDKLEKAAQKSSP